MKVGDYVRTKKGTIYQFNSTSIKALSGAKKYMVKSSPNIIDLIEVGDYVNGEKVYYLKGQVDERDVAHEKDVVYTEYIDEYGEWYGYAEDEIESILTHEQFSQMEYKVGEQ